MGSCNYTIKCFFFFFFWFLLCVLSTSMTITSSSSSLVDDNAYIVYMEREKGAQQVHYHDYHPNQLHELLGSKEAAREAFLYSYKHTIYGFAAKLTEPQAKKMAELPGVVSVVRNRAYKLHTTRSWDYLGLSFPSSTNEFLNDDHQTSPSDNLLSKTNMGEGIIVGILDTGVWPESRSFDDQGYGQIPTKWNGFCEGGQEFNPKTACNRKLIGARMFNLGGRNISLDYLSPRDGLGHGTHVSSTAIGSVIKNASYKGQLALGTARGGAPRACLAMYKVCWNSILNGGDCSSIDIVKGFDEAISDGVDVLSLSLGSGVPLATELTDVFTASSFHAVSMGIPVVAAAGNAGPFAQTTDHVEPWIITVAASTIDRAFPTPIILGNNQTLTGQSMFIGSKILSVGLFFQEPSGNCNDLNKSASSVAGNVVLCFGDYYPTEVENNQGVTIILANNPTEYIYEYSFQSIPCIQVDLEIGTQIVNYIRSTKSPIVSIGPTKTRVGKPISTKVAIFSSRGPSSVSPAILKPDIAAPGLNILAQTTGSRPEVYQGFTFLSGTSMATPHVAGVVALLRALHPGWSPAAIKSALTTTASTTESSGEPIFAEGNPRKVASPFDYGGGVINPDRAADPGLVYDMGRGDYIMYLCAMGYKEHAISNLVGEKTTCSKASRASILDVNVPSITVPNLRVATTVTLHRTVTNVGPELSVYEARVDLPTGVDIVVTPDKLMFNSMIRTASYSVMISSSQYSFNTGYYFGSLTWSNGVHAVKIPISVRIQVIEMYTDDN